MNCPKCNSVNVVPAAGMMRCQDCGHYFETSSSAKQPPVSRVPNLIQCPACLQSVSPNAADCPKCGEPLRSVTNRAKLNWNIFVFVVLLILVLILWEILRGMAAIDKI